ncbi:hypothetical protein FG87_19565 [Nocardia vulneris]|uniref:Lipoprotein n=1 Tax=Nocardia vulneris TaxID=1141657 RepID=A0ABR4ZDF7_9NOCA|nr:hypothetical protein FG87_19565 [Nocardia vulneris]
MSMVALPVEVQALPGDPTYDCEFMTAVESGTVDGRTEGTIDFYGKKETYNSKTNIPVYGVVATGCKPRDGNTPESGIVEKPHIGIIAKSGEVIYKDDTKTEYDLSMTGCPKVDAGDGSGNIFGFGCSTPTGYPAKKKG